MAEVQGEQLKKKLQLFLGDMIRFGCVKGFRYFSMYLRGREEMLLNVINEIADVDNYSLSSVPTSPTSISPAPFGLFSLNASFNSGNLPYDKKTLLMSSQAQKNPGDGPAGLPPASPSDGDIAFGDPNTTLFLLAGYARYESPHVWVRSNHDRLMRLAGRQDKDKDKPLRLKSVRHWPETDIKVWDVVAEVIKLCTYPPPRNPFAIDVAYFESLQPKERLLATGAMMHALQTIIASKVDDAYYTAKVMSDMQIIATLHFETVQEVASKQQLPCLQEYQTRVAEQHAAEQQASRTRYMSGHYPTRYQYYTPGYQYTP